MDTVVLTFQSLMQSGTLQSHNIWQHFRLEDVAQPRHWNWQHRKIVGPAKISNVTEIGNAEVSDTAIGTWKAGGFWGQAQI